MRPSTATVQRSAAQVRRIASWEMTMGRPLAPVGCLVDVTVITREVAAATGSADQVIEGWVDSAERCSTTDSCLKRLHCDRYADGDCDPQSPFSRPCQVTEDSWPIALLRRILSLSKFSDGHFLTRSSAG